jgi:hypothetical protein
MKLLLELCSGNLCLITRRFPRSAGFRNVVPPSGGILSTEFKLQLALQTPEARSKLKLELHTFLLFE